MRQKDVPRELLIGESLWVIKFARVVPGEEKDLLGLCNPCEKTIYIKQKQSFQERLDTLIHELIHAINFEYNFEIKHQHIYKLATCFAKLVVDNF